MIFNYFYKYFDGENVLLICENVMWMLIIIIIDYKLCIFYIVLVIMMWSCLVDIFKGNNRKFGIKGNCIDFYILKKKIFDSLFLIIF